MDTRALIGKAKSDDVTKLLAILKEDLTSSKVIPEERRSALERLKIHGRDPRDAESIFTQNGIQILTRQGLDTTTSPSSLEALRCLANAMLLESKTRQIFVDLGYAGRAAERLKNQDSDNEFLISRLLLLTTYDTNLDFDSLFEKHSLSESINNHINRHAEQFAKGSPGNHPNSFQQAALSECLKLLFNLSNFYPQHVITFTPSVEPILKILGNVLIPNPPLQPPINYLINALVNLDLDDRQASSCITTTNLNALTHILTLTLSSYPSDSLQSNLTPLIILLRKIASSPSISPTQKSHLQSLLLPSNSDRDLPLGQSNTLPSKLLRLSTTTTSPTLRDAISALLFDLSDRDPTTFVQNVGYGYAAGFLLSHDIPIPAAAVGAAFPNTTPFEQQNNNKEEDGDAPKWSREGEGEELINPITGQKMSKESVLADEGPPMSQEEKEREAERLFVLFERLRATGVVGVRDPVREAVESGRFDRTGGRRERRSGDRLEEIEGDDEDDEDD